MPLWKMIICRTRKRKTPYNDEYDIKEMTRKAFENNFQVSVKANGDRAVNSTLNAIESVTKEVKPKAAEPVLNTLSSFSRTYAKN